MNSLDDLLYLAACSINRQRPDPDRIAGMDMEALMNLSYRHKMTSMIAMAILCAVDNEGQLLEQECYIKWRELKETAVRKNVLLDVEREKILSFFENQGIWYLPLKGILLKECYPCYGMREMADNDILYDRSFQQAVCTYMISQGYKAESVGRGVHDTYLKEPVYNFEFHTSLFSGALQDGIPAIYYADVMRRAIKDDGKKYGYHLSADDLYVYITAHAFKHYDNSGTGLRTLTDDFVFRKSKEPEMHFDIIDQELDNLGILKFGRTLRSLSEQLLADPEKVYSRSISQTEEKMLSYMSGAGAYGTLEYRTKNHLRKLQGNNKQTAVNTKLKYIINRIFPDAKYMKQYHPLCVKYPVFIPGMYAFRFIKAMVTKSRYIGNELAAIIKA